MPVIQGIMISEAAIIVENAFRDVLSFNDDALAQLSLEDKFNLYCSSAQLKTMLEYIRSDGSGGLPNMSPPRTILIEALNSISTGTTIRTLVRRVSDNAFYTQS